MKTLEARFWEKVDQSSACWLWTAGRSSSGYGQFRVGKRLVQANRVAWMLAFGAIPNGLDVLHRCDTPACVRVAHLFLGTHEDNVRDMVVKRRHTHGETHPQARLAIADVVEILRLRKAGMTQKDVAARFGISQTSVSRIVHGKQWREATERIERWRAKLDHAPSPSGVAADLARLY